VQRVYRNCFQVRVSPERVIKHKLKNQQSHDDSKNLTAGSGEDLQEMEEKFFKKIAAENILAREEQLKLKQCDDMIA